MATSLPWLADIARAPKGRLPARVADVRLSIFQSGHGAVASGGTGTLSDDTTNYALGAQSLKVITDGAGGNSRYELAFAAKDLTARTLKFMIKVDKTLKTELNGITVYAQSGGTWANYYQCNILDNPAGLDRNIYLLADEWITVTVSRGNFVVGAGTPAWTNITAIRISLFDVAGTVVTARHNLLAHQPEPAAGVISLTFDDGWLSNYTIARPKMDAYGYPGTLYQIVQRATEADAGTDTNAMTTAQITALHRHCGWEIASHAYSLTKHNSTGGFTDFTDAEIEEDFRLMRDWLVRNSFGGLGGEHFSWPRGKFNAAKLALAKRYFASVRTTHSQTTETYPPADPSRLRCVNAGSGWTLAQLKAYVDLCKNQRAWGIFMFHDIVPVPSGALAGIQTATADFNDLVDYIASQGVTVRTIGDVLAHGVA